MKRALLISIILVSALAVCAEKQTLTLPAGVRFPATLKTKLDAGRLQAGDLVRLEMTASLRGPGGKIVLPQGAKLTGHIVSVAVKTKEQAVSYIAIVVEHAEWKSGRMPLHAAFDADQPKVFRPISSDTGFHRDVPQEMLGVNENCMSGMTQRPTNWSDSNIGNSAVALPIDEVQYRKHEKHGIIAASDTVNVVIDIDTRLNLVQIP